MTVTEKIMENRTDELVMDLTILLALRIIMPEVLAPTMPKDAKSLAIRVATEQILGWQHQPHKPAGECRPCMWNRLHKSAKDIVEQLNAIEASKG